jgi:hypothetical protein
VSASGGKKRVHGKLLYCFYKAPPCCRINNGFETREKNLVNKGAS